MTFNTTIYKLKGQYEFLNQCIAIKYFNLCNSKINKNSMLHITAYLNNVIDKIIIPASTGDYKVKYTFNTHIVFEDSKNIIMNITVNHENNLEIITVEYLNVSNNNRIMIKLLCYSSYNLQDILDF